MEVLANELILDALEYLSTMDIFHSFNGLNNRFDNLILEYFRTHKCLDFRLGSKADIQLIRRRYLPLIIDQIERIYLSDADTNPHEIDFFLSRLCPFFRFENLKSISLDNIYSIEKMFRMLDDFQRLSHLINLHFSQCYIQADQKSILTLMNKIWSLPHLNHCYLDISFHNHDHFIPPTFISCSLRQLIVKGVRCLVGNLSLLYESTPSLEYLSLKLWNAYDDEHQLNRMPTITKFECQCEDNSIAFATILRQMPNLIQLNINTKNIQMDGKLWQMIIHKYLLQLKNFQLEMEMNLENETNVEEEINRIIDSYRTPFWIEEHQWFIRCFWNEESDQKMLYLHTLPFQNDHLSLRITDSFQTRSTCSDDTLFSNYNHVKSLTYASNLVESPALLDISFSYLHHLSLTFPLHDSFRNQIPRFDHLISLELRILDWSNDDEDLIQIQGILDQAPRLFAVRFHSWPSSLTSKPFQSRKVNQNNETKMAPFSIRSFSIRHLVLTGLKSTGDSQYYNDQQCSALIRSPLGNQCEYLQIEVEKRTSILDLVKKMSHLRTLHVRCRDQKTNDLELIKWLQNRLPSTCSLAKDSHSSTDIRLWIR